MEPVRFYCAECGELAATVELIAPTSEPRGPEDIGFDQWKLRVNGPVPTTNWVLRGLDVLQQALREGSVTALRAINPEYVNCWCPKCSATYCKEHWAPITPEMDEGFYDATYGTCPKGHRIMLDD